MVRYCVMSEYTVLLGQKSGYGGVFDSGFSSSAVTRVLHRYGMGQAGQNCTHTHQHHTHMQTIWQKNPQVVNNPWCAATDHLP